ncbi:MAG: hypothetical protein ACJASX_003281 [Limisphaerales bacterium]|jgi:hypothetical protein
MRPVCGVPVGLPEKWFFNVCSRNSIAPLEDETLIRLQPLKLSKNQKNELGKLAVSRFALSCCG